MGYNKLSLFCFTFGVCILQTALLIRMAFAETTVGNYCYFGTCKKVVKIDTVMKYKAGMQECAKLKMEVYNFWDQDDYDWITARIKGSSAPAYWTSVCQWPVIAEPSNTTLDKFTRVNYKLDGEVEKAGCVNCQPLSEITLLVGVPDYHVARCILISKSGVSIYRIIYHKNAGVLCQQIL